MNQKLLECCKKLLVSLDEELQDEPVPPSPQARYGEIRCEAKAVIAEAEIKSGGVVVITDKDRVPSEYFYTYKCPWCWYDSLDGGSTNTGGDAYCGGCGAEIRWQLGQSGASLSPERDVPLATEIERIPVMTLSAFAIHHHLVMKVVERPGHGRQGLARFYAYFDRIEVQQGSFVIGSFGDGDTPAEAIADYAREISEKPLVYASAYPADRREFTAPRFKERTNV